MALEALQYKESNGKAALLVLDQRSLPTSTNLLDIASIEEGWQAIKDMAVRGAPAIAIAGALTLAVSLVNGGKGEQFKSAAEASQYVNQQLQHLVTSRPTAVNLSDAASKLSGLAEQIAAKEDATGRTVTSAVVAACKQMLKDDVAANMAMGKHGAAAILEEVKKRGKTEGSGLELLTHCNTGSLATAGFGTALGLVRAVREQGKLQHIYCTETRPYNQGSRLTAYELVHDGLPATLIADSAAAALMASGKVDAVVVGADRVAANGDTANKIGTFSLAVAASHHGIPFYIAAPTTTLDATLANGSLINIEEREPYELTHYQGIQVAAPGINVWNPSFDVTPAALITGIITERGLVAKSASGSFDVGGFRGGEGPLSDDKTSTEKQTSTIPGFYALDVESVKDYIAGHPELARRVGNPTTAAEWKVQEVGDGNINFVYIVKGPLGSVVVKQGLPYIRIAKDWPLTQERARIEARALAEEAKHCSEHVPELYHYDPQLALLVIQYLAPPHDILRRALVAGHTFPLLSSHVATFLARTLFRTSLLALDSATFRKQVAIFQNSELCRLTEQVIFSDPYYEAPVNRHTSPQLDAQAAAFQQDTEAKVAATRLKVEDARLYIQALFCERQQALLHGDLHTGSFMVTTSSTYAIDAEFACYGPMAFDVCKMIANLLLAFLAADGLADQGAPRTAQQQWLLQCVEEIWTKFKAEFVGLWSDAVKNGKAGDLNHPGVYPGADFKDLGAFQAAFMDELFKDSLAFAGAVMIRRILGIAHVIDFESIKNADVRSVCEARALKVGRALLVSPEAFASISAVTAYADNARKDRKQPYGPLN